jgi:hypothetical protein
MVRHSSPSLIKTPSVRLNNIPMSYFSNDATISFSKQLAAKRKTEVRCDLVTFFRRCFPLGVTIDPLARLEKTCRAIQSQGHDGSQWGSHAGVLNKRVMTAKPACVSVHLGNRSAARARALAISSARFLDGALVSSERRRLLDTAAISSTAARNATSLAFDGLLKPLTFRTNCNEAARVSSAVTGGSKLKRVLMFLHTIITSTWSS